VQAERDVRVKRAQRGQITWGRVDLDAEVPADHEVRAIAAVVDKHPALHHRERVATLTLTVDRSSSGGCPRSRPRAGYTHFIPAVASDEALPAALAADPRPPPLRGRSHRPLAVPSGAANRAHALSCKRPARRAIVSSDCRAPVTGPRPRRSKNHRSNPPDSCMAE
jgi:hypothetical protein